MTVLAEPHQLDDGPRFEFCEFEGLPSQLPTPHSIVAFDTETTSLHPDDTPGGRWLERIHGTVSVVSVGWLDGRGQLWAAAYPFGQGPGEPTTDPLRDNAIDREQDLGKREWDILLDWLARAPFGLVGHHSKFDVLHLAGAAKPGYPGRNLNGYVRFDSMVAAREFWPQESAALKAIGVRMFEEDADAEQAALKPYLGPKTNPRYDLVPWPVMKPYAVQDAVLTLRTWMVQDPLWQEGYYGAHFLGSEIAISATLARLELAGIPYDAKASLECAQQLEAEIEKLSGELPFDPKKAKQFYFGEATPVDLGKGEVTPLGLPAYRVTDKGAPSLTADVLVEMVNDKQPYAQQLQTINRHKSAVSKWYTPFAQRTGADGRLRTSFRQVASGAEGVGGTRSGRFSAGRVNMQAVPQDYHIFLPVPSPRQIIAQATKKQCPGWWLYELDLAQAELRVAAQDAGCDTMLNIVRAGGDVHGETAKQLFNTDRDHDDFDFNRQVAKRANFAQPMDEPILTPHGWVEMGLLKVGDRVTGSNGGDQKVIAIPYQGWCDEYEVTGEGLTTRCSPGHLWWVQPKDGRCAWRAMHAEDIRRSGAQWFVPRNPPVEYDPIELPVDPYILGALLGDGSYRTMPEIRILTSDREIADEMQRRCADRAVEATYAGRPNMTRFGFCGGNIYGGLKALGLVKGYKQPVTGANKFIPDVYFRGSVQQRIDLLRGLMDTDGFASCGGYSSYKGTVGTTVKFTNNAPALIEGVADLVRSLGGKATVRWKSAANTRCKPSATVSMQIPFNPFHLTRKAERWRPPRRIDRIEIEVRPTGRRVMQRCITVSNDDSLYITRDYRVTSNSLIFGSGWKTFQEMIQRESGVKLSQHQSQEIVYGWRDLYPEFGRRIAHYEDFVRSMGYVKLRNGKRRYYATFEDFHSGFNQYVQGSLAEYAKRWLLATDRQLYPLRQLGVEAGIGRGGLLLVVHDSQVLLLPDESADAICQQVRGQGVRLWNQFFPGCPGDIDIKRWKGEEDDG